MNSPMKISILVDNEPGTKTSAEHGLSYLIDFGGKRILFDTGQSDLFLRNAKIMKINIENIDMIILSHGHFDHGNGLGYLSDKTLICHPGCFVSRYRGTDLVFIGLKNSKTELSRNFNLITSAKPYEISEKIYFLGEIPRLTDFESRNTSFVFKNNIPDYVIDDSALAMILPQGLFVVTGCGHSGIVNTLEHARKVTSVKEIYGVIGGFHLKEVIHQTRQTIKYLDDNEVTHVIPSHCTGTPALEAFRDKFGSVQVRSGDILEF
jgi:7,8-dihydropterin-6-yl-methyl-4-(beta-D-ribofuranosyl)aminobenzene 5'-phosphate synthase